MPSPAMIVACMALAVALSGASYAAVVLPRNSVGTVQLKRDAVTAAKVKDGTLKQVDFALGQIPAGPAGLAGPAGPQGPAGPAGPQGLRGPSFGDAKYADSVPVSGCGVDTTTMSYAVNLGAPARLYVTGQASYTRTDPGAELPSLMIELTSGATVVASTTRVLESIGVGERDLLTVGGVLRSTTAGTSGFNVPAGAYTLRMVLDSFGSCAGTGTYSYVTLSHVVLGTS